MTFTQIDGERMMQEVIDQLPATFTLDTHPERTFRINRALSEYDGATIQLALYEQSGDHWFPFCYMTVSQLFREITTPVTLR